MKKITVLWIGPWMLLLCGCAPMTGPEPAVSATEISGLGAPMTGPEPAVSATEISGLRAEPRSLRVDLLWDSAEGSEEYQVEWSEEAEGPFQALVVKLPMIPLASDVVGEEGVTRYYRIRAVSETGSPGLWSEVVSATTRPFDREVFLTEVQEAGFRYFHHYAFPGSHLPREGIRRKDSWDPFICSAVSTGMYFFNMAVGIERGFIERGAAGEHARTLLRFLEQRVDRFHGAFPHWIDGRDGKVVPFSETDDGADSVETAILAQGLLFAREYFTGDNEVEREIRERADRLWKEIEWDRLVGEARGRRVLIWHWSPRYGFSNLPVVGFNESELAYLLAIGSPTHPIDPDIYWEGWVGLNDGYLQPRQVEEPEGTIPLQLGGGYGFPMFFMHYSYLGLEPSAVPLPEGTLQEEFEWQTRAHIAYARLNADRFKGYDRFWGLTASLSPDGYLAHHPELADNGTITPTAALSSMPYHPEAVMEMMETLYLEEGKTLWGPFGFYDAFNPTRGWVADGYIGIDIGPIGPMIENARSGLLWEVFMRAPEIQNALDRVFRQSTKAQWGLHP